MIWSHTMIDREIKELKREHKELNQRIKKVYLKRLDDRMSNSWRNLRNLKKLKLKIKDKIMNKRNK